MECHNEPFVQLLLIKMLKNVLGDFEKFMILETFLNMLYFDKYIQQLDFLCNAIMMVIKYGHLDFCFVGLLIL
jgi:hypothetical protein